MAADLHSRHLLRIGDGAGQDFYDSIVSLSNRVGFKAQFIPASHAYSTLKTRLDSATTEVLVLTSDFGKNRHRDDTSSKQNRTDYLGELLSVVQKRQLKYERVLQVSPGSDIRNTLTPDHEYTVHLKKMLETKLTHGHNIAAFSAISHWNLGFIIIDATYLALQIDGIDPKTGTPRYEGGLYIDDPHGIIIPEFRRTFDRIRNSGKAIESTDLN